MQIKVTASMKGRNKAKMVIGEVRIDSTDMTDTYEYYIDHQGKYHCPELCLVCDSMNHLKDNCIFHYGRHGAQTSHA